MFSLKGRVAAITGASSGLGLQMARVCRASADLVIMARRIERLEAIADKFRAEGVRCLRFSDVTKTDEVKSRSENRLSTLWESGYSC